MTTTPPSTPSRDTVGFLVDENVQIAMLSPLTKWNIVLIGVKDAGLMGKPDDAVFAYAHDKGLFIVTTDRDFYTQETPGAPRSWGTLILPYPSGKGPVRAQMTEDALAHFTAQTAGLLLQRNGTIINYRRDKRCVLHVHPTTPARGLLTQDIGPYTYG